MSKGGTHLNDLVLSIKLDALKQNLMQVENVLTLIEERHLEMQQLHKLFCIDQEIQGSLVDILENLSATRLRLDFIGKTEPKVKDQIKKLEIAENGVKKIYSDLDFVEQTLKSIENRCVHISSEEDTSIKKTLDLGIIKKAILMAKAVECIQNGPIKNARESDDKSKANEFMRDAWKEYTGMMQKDSPKIFYEYVDLLRGLAMRNTGLDGGQICKLADELVEKCKMVDKVVWGSLTIPARQEAVSMTLARIIRLGFPEWTIWALPLTAHEFGHVVASENDKVREWIKKESDKYLGISSIAKSLIEYHLQEYVADAFAIYAMGPAYACAAILLRFDPVNAYTDSIEHPAHSKRTYLILNMLKEMQKHAPLDDPMPYRKIIENLEKEWNIALEQAGLMEISEDEVTEIEVQKRLNAILDCISRNPIEGLPKQSTITIEKLIRELSAVLELATSPYAVYENEHRMLTEWTKSLYSLLGEITGVAYPISSWRRSESLKENLLFTSEGQTIGPSPSVDLRDVLNAAWSCRLDLQGKTTIIENNASKMIESISGRPQQGKIDDYSKTSAPSGMIGGTNL
jgi:hypothetical protein